MRGTSSPFHREEDQGAGGHVICQGPSAEKWSWGWNQELSDSSDGQFHSATLPSASTGCPALFFFLLEVKGNHLNKHGRKTPFRLHHHPTKLKGQSHSFTERPGGEGVDKQVGTKWVSLEKSKNDIRRCMQFSYNRRGQTRVFDKFLVPMIQVGYLRSSSVKPGGDTHPAEWSIQEALAFPHCSFSLLSLSLIY